MECPEIHAEGNPSVTPAQTLWRSQALTADTGAQLHTKLPEPAVSTTTYSFTKIFLWNFKQWQMVTSTCTSSICSTHGVYCIQEWEKNDSLMPSWDEWTSTSSNSGAKTQFLKSSVVLGLERRGIFNSPACRCKGILFCWCTAWADHAFTCCVYFCIL